MVTLKISENLARLRKQRKITQEELAEFLGVTKASVSKWETMQSYPDIMLLPVIANYFDITVDELIGFQAQLSPEQITKLYADMSQMFADKPFEEAYQYSRKLAKQYYACYPFLIACANLWINHYILAGSPERRTEVLNDICEIISHIELQCSDLYVRNDALALKMITLLQLGKCDDVIEILSQLRSPDRLCDNLDIMLTQAYLMKGDTEKAVTNAQVTLYAHLIQIISDSVLLLSIEASYKPKCEITISRTEKIIEAYNIKNIHPNSYLQFQLQAALFCASDSQNEKAIGYLHAFTDVFLKMLSTEKIVSTDSYFDKIDKWFDALPLSGQMPRSKQVIAETTMQIICGPAFAKLADDPAYKNIIKQLDNFHTDILNHK